jgi:hypothetical protein
MTVSVVQNRGTAGYSTFGSAAFLSPTTAGNTVLLVDVYVYNNAQPEAAPAILWDGNPVTGAYRVGGADVLNVGISTGQTAWVLPNAPSGTTVTLPGNNITIEAGWELYEIAGLGPAPVVDVYEHGTASTGGSPVPVPVGPTAATSLFPNIVIGVMGSTAGFSNPWDASYSNEAASGNSSNGHIIPTEAGHTYTYTPTVNNASSWTGQIFSLATPAPAINHGQFFPFF